MKTVRDLMTANVVWISPSARVKTAVILMKGHRISALPVMQPDENVVGLVTQLALLGASPESPVSEVMERDYVVTEPDASAADAAEMLNAARACCLLVFENDRMIGIVTRSDLMPELGKNFDPLTGLQWSDGFREWATRALKHGIEISVIFFDLDQFGIYNKVHGHPVGDAVLKEVAQVLKTGIDPELDFACRYGGDEFVVVSSRHRDEAVELAERLKSRIDQIRLPSIPEGVSATYGIFGGRRTKEREDIHYAATIDDLVTRASKNCTASKPRGAEAAAPAAPAAAPAQAPEAKAPARLKIRSVAITTSETDVRASVVLSLGEREFKAEASGYSASGATALRAAAEAAALAAAQSLDKGHVIAVEGVTVQRLGPEDEAVSVAATFIGPRVNVRHVGSALVRRGDHHRTAVAALLASVNRLIEPHGG